MNCCSRRPQYNKNIYHKITKKSHNNNNNFYNNKNNNFCNNNWFPRYACKPPLRNSFHTHSRATTNLLVCMLCVMSSVNHSTIHQTDHSKNQSINHPSNQSSSQSPNHPPTINGAGLGRGDGDDGSGLQVSRPLQERPPLQRPTSQLTPRRSPS